MRLRDGFASIKASRQECLFAFLITHLKQKHMKVSKKIKERLEELRGELRAARLSYGELFELQTLSKYIDSGDVELLEAAGVKEKPKAVKKTKTKYNPARIIVLDFETAEVHVHPFDINICKDKNNAESETLEALGYSESNCQWMVVDDKQFKLTIH